MVSKSLPAAAAVMVQSVKSPVSNPQFATKLPGTASHMLRFAAAKPGSGPKNPRIAANIPTRNTFIAPLVFLCDSSLSYDRVPGLLKGGGKAKRGRVFSGVAFA